MGLDLISSDELRSEPHKARRLSSRKPVAPPPVATTFSSAKAGPMLSATHAAMNQKQAAGLAACTSTPMQNVTWSTYQTQSPHLQAAVPDPHYAGAAGYPVVGQAS